MKAKLFKRSELDIEEEYLRAEADYSFGIANYKEAFDTMHLAHVRMQVLRQELEVLRAKNRNRSAP